ncbi:DUF4811 domain-containing protein [Lactiplantibacillus modestisalitolerans]|uniref:DUF4811 domain-containing protein n=1 Tax=Lactiplantibacillus modestisalitolerans TaxID=1457219 RepID=A0ABV5WUJ7_9LACO|nr:DUF4811 domain-containing protein [Lactiplantibacillus modestisalitolerans]
MILVILGIGLAGFILGLLLMPTHRSQLTVGGISLVVLVGAAILMIGNDQWHWGMHCEKTTHVTALQPTISNPNVNFLLYSPVKQAEHEKVYVYRRADHQKQLHTAASLKTTNRVTRTHRQSARLLTIQHRWAYNNHWWRTLFRGTGHHNLLIRETNTFEIPANWSVLSVNQAKWLEKRANRLTTTARKTSAQAVASQLKRAQAANPRLNATQLTALKRQYEQKAQQAAHEQARAAVPALLEAAQRQSIYE